MDTASVESSLYKFLYDNFEAPLGIKVFESVYYVDFKSFDKWIVIDSLGNTGGSLPKANFFLHISIKHGLARETQVLNRLVDQVTKVIYPGVGIDVYDDADEVLVGGMQVSNALLTPVMKHLGGGSYRSLSIGIVYPGDIYPSS